MSARVAGSTATTETLTNRAVDAIDRGVLWFVEHWIHGLFGVAATLTLLPFVAPLLRSNGFEWPARAIYLSYRLVCHQRSERSFHLFGEKMAVCERDIAILVTTSTLLGLYLLARGRWSPHVPRIIWPVLLALPMGLDGGTQLVGLRESTWELRLITGALFSIGATWLTLPYLDAAFRDVRTAMAARLRSTPATSASDRGAGE